MFKQVRYLPILGRYIGRQFWIPINRLILKMNHVVYGKNCLIFNKFYILVHYGAEVYIGNDLLLTSGSCFNPLSRNIRGSIYAASKAIVKIGNNVGISSSCIWSSNSISIGNNVKIGSDVIIIDNDAHNLDYIIRRNSKIDVASSAPIVIGDDVLIGTKSIVLKGVTIGDRSIIGAGSVVTRNIPADCIAGGNPCLVIKKINQAHQNV